MRYDWISRRILLDAVKRCKCAHCELGFAEGNFFPVVLKNRTVVHVKCLRDYEAGQREARVFSSMFDALEWLVNIGHDTGRGGDRPEPGEFEDAMKYAEGALAAARETREGWKGLSSFPQLLEHLEQTQQK